MAFSRTKYDEQTGLSCKMAFSRTNYDEQTGLSCKMVFSGTKYGDKTGLSRKTVFSRTKDDEQTGVEYKKCHSELDRVTLIVISKPGIPFGLFQRLDVELDWLDHVLWREDCVEVLLRENTVLEDEVVDTLACSHCFLRDLSRVLVADDWVKGSHHTKALVYVVAALLWICSDAVDTVDAESVETVHHDRS